MSDMENTKQTSSVDFDVVTDVAPAEVASNSKKEERDEPASGGGWLLD